MRFLELSILQDRKQDSSRHKMARGECEAKCLLGTEFQLGKDENVLEKDGGDASTTMWMYLMPQSCTLKNG